MSYRRKHIKPKIRSLKPQKSFFKRPVFWIFLGLLIIITATYFILFFPKFQIVKIKVSGNEKIKSQNIEDIAWISVNRRIITAGILNVSSKSIFIIDTKSLVKNILSEFPYIQEVKVKKELPDNLILKIKERKPFAVFCDIEKDCFFMDENGVIFELLKNIPENILIVRQPLNSNDIFMGGNVIQENLINIISKVRKNLNDNFQIDIKEAFISNPLVFTTSENWKVYFDPTSDINLQITKMNLLLKNEITTDERKNIQYIYLQYKDRAYYK